MGKEIEMINDGEGVALVGDATAIEQFLTSQGIPSRELNLRRLGPALGSTAGLLQAGSTVSADYGRWVKLTESSAAAFSTSARMRGSAPGVSRAILTENGGRISGILEIIDGPGAMLTNPALMTGAAGIMAQVAMEQAMAEITDYLAVIDAKVDDVLRAQKDAVIADMIGVDFVLDEAMMIRKQVGRVSEITWSKVQSTSFTISRTQAYALRQLGGLAEKLEEKTKVDDLADISRQAERTVQEWLAVLAHCFRLQDGMAVLELDRVLDASPEELDRHRMALRAVRDNRLEQIATSTRTLLARMNAAVDTANAGVLLNPISAGAVVRARNHVTVEVVEFQSRLGLEGEQNALEGRRWRDAAGDVRDRVVETGSGGFDTAVRVGGDTLESARATTGRFADGVAQRLRRRRNGGGDDAGH